MRPQRNAAENPAHGAATGLARRASMRPQRNAAENAEGGRGNTRGGSASMRPQRNAAENDAAANAQEARLRSLQ